MYSFFCQNQVLVFSTNPSLLFCTFHYTLITFILCDLQCLLLNYYFGIFDCISSLLCVDKVDKVHLVDNYDVFCSFSTCLNVCTFHWPFLCTLLLKTNVVFLKFHCASIFLPVDIQTSCILLILPTTLLYCMYQAQANYYVLCVNDAIHGWQHCDHVRYGIGWCL